MIQRMRGSTLTSMYASWSYPSWANPYLPQGIIERERERLPEEVFQQEYGGRFVGQGLPLCDVCLFPRQVAELKPMVFYEGEDREYCSECGRLAYRDGLSAVTADGFHLKSLRFPCEREDGPEDLR